MKRGKRGIYAIFLLISITICVLVSSLFTVADHNSANVTLTPTTVYETVSMDYELNVDNYGSESVIEEVRGDLDGFTVTDAASYHGWDTNYTTDSIKWEDGTIETNVRSALFEFTGKAPKVDEDEQYTLRFETEDEENDIRIHEFLLTILNDETGPELNDSVPYDGAFAKEGDDNYGVSVNATDPETGVKDVYFEYGLCGDNETSLSLDADDGLYTETVDLSDYENEDELCFTFEGESNGGAQSTYTGVLTVDGIAPTITLLNPDDNAMLNANSEFEFRAEDNLAPTLHCELLVDGNAEAEVEAENGKDTSINAQNISEGEHEWQIRCEDLAGWQAQSGTRSYTLDKTPPKIVASPENGSILAEGDQIMVTVTDDNGVDEVKYIIGSLQYVETSPFEIDTIGWDEGPKDIEITARDTAGNNVTETYTYIIDKTPPDIELISPLNETVDVHIDLEFNVEDDYDTTPLCEAYVDDELVASEEVEEGDNVLSAIVPPGNVTWRIECEDDAGNRGVSEDGNVNIMDMSGPDIEIENITYVPRGSPINLEALITDPSGVADVTASIELPDGTDHALTVDEDDPAYTINYPTAIDSDLGDYIVTFNAKDTLGYDSSESHTVFLTYNYIITLSLSPSTADKGETVTVNGNVEKDDGSMIPENQITLDLPGVGEVHVNIDSSGDFVYAFEAPDEAGDYDVAASVTSDDNGITYSETAELTVKGSTKSSYYEGSGSGSTRYSELSEGTTTTGSADVISTISSETEEPKETSGGSSVIEDIPEGNGDDMIPLEEGADVNGIGKASGFFNIDSIKKSKLLWSLLILLIIIAILAAIMRPRKEKEPRKEEPTIDDKLGLEEYLNQRLK